MRRVLPAIPLALALAGPVGLPVAGRSGATAEGAAFTGVPAQVADSRFGVHFLDVGTGDSAIIDIGNTEVVIDGGLTINTLTQYLNRTGILNGQIELVIVTHGDSDHWKGLTRLLGFDDKNTNPPAVREFWEPGYDRDCNPLASFTQFIDDMQGLENLTARRPLEDTRTPAVVSGGVSVIKLPGAPNLQLRLLHSDSTPESTNKNCGYTINNASIVFSAQIFGHRFLFSGDANGKERAEAPPGTPGHIEKLLLDFDTAHPGTLQADVLKAPHHGSETASTQTFIDRVNPSFVVISASTQHDLPKDTVVARYDNGERVILSTDRDPEAAVDHIICFEDAAQDLTCGHEADLRED